MKITLPQHQHNRNPAFSRLFVSDIMRRQVVTQPLDQTIAAAVRTLIKYKIDALLVLNEDRYPAGVITKTEIMGSYYATLPATTMLADIMGSPVIYCTPEDTLESALVTMQQAAIHRIYVIDESGRAVATLSYPDIVGALYRYCCICDFGLRQKKSTDLDVHSRYCIREVMTRSVTTAQIIDPIMEVIEKLSSFHIGALPIVDSSGSPLGVISKTDLALAYRRDISLDAMASVIMSTPVQLCEENELLETGIHRMVLNEISRIFVYSGQEKTLSGVLTLSDAARIRSGSCQACSSSRIIVKK